MSQPRPATVEERNEFNKKFGDEFELLSVEFSEQKNKIYTFHCKMCGSTLTREESACLRSKKIGISICVHCNKNNGRRRSDESLFDRVDAFAKENDLIIENLDEVLQKVQNNDFNSFSLITLRSKKFPILTTRKTVNVILHKQQLPFWMSNHRGSFQKAIFYYLFHHILQPELIESEYSVCLNSGKHLIDYVIRVDDQNFYCETGFFKLRKYSDDRNCKTSLYISELRQKFGYFFVELYREQKSFDKNLFNKSRLLETRLGYLRNLVEATAQLIIDNFTGRAKLYYTNSSDATNAVFEDMKRFYKYYISNIRPLR